MSGNFTRDNCRLVGAHLTDTTDTTILTGSGYMQVIGARVANVTGTDATVTLNYYSKADDSEYRLLYQHTVPANGAIWLPLEAFSLKTDDEIRAQAGTASALDVVLSISETPGRSG